MYYIFAIVNEAIIEQSISHSQGMIYGVVSELSQFQVMMLMVVLEMK